MEEETVNLIASGYDWECPSCGAWNKTIEVVEEVECIECRKTFEVEDHFHAYS